MPRRYKVLLALLGAVLCAVLIGSFSHAPGVFGKTYQGHTLEYWTRQLYPDRTLPQSKEALVAIRALCSNNLPELVAALDYDPYTRELKMRARFSWLGRGLYYDVFVAGPLKDRKATRFRMARVVLETLAADADVAIPQLAPLTRSTNIVIAGQAYQTISLLGTNGLFFLLSSMTDASNPWRLDAMEQFVFALGTQAVDTNVATAALPVMLECLRSDQAREVRLAASALGRLKMDPARSVPALIAALRNNGDQSRMEVIGALGEFGPSAGAAVPDLTRELQDTTWYIRAGTSNALLSIAPEVLTNAQAR